MGICLVVAGIGSVFTASSVDTWYPRLRKPSGTPPAWIFAPVWTVLYLLMGTAAWLVWLSRAGQSVRLSLALFLAQLVLNAAWSGIFFGLRKPGLALVEILALWCGIALAAVSFLAHSRAAFWMMVPYLVWVTYATYLNFGIWRLNRRLA